MDRTGDVIIFIVGMIGGLAILFVAPILENVFKIRFAEEIILFITIFVGGSLYSKRRRRTNPNP